MQPTSSRSGATALTFESMGTVVSLRTGAGAGVSGRAPARDALERVFRRWDERFSLYREDSELSRIARGELLLTQASPILRDCYAVALSWRERTGGAFTPHRADGVIDLSGVVKAMAIAEAGDVLTGLGLGHWCINAGGDILVSGRPDEDSEWTVAIVDPTDRQEVLANVPLREPVRAVATSGSAERGEHIWTAADGASPYLQVSVFAPDIVTADVLATAIVAGGADALEHSTAGFPIDVLAVLRDGGLLATPGLRGDRA
jgi:thiamine biosynthesis lipoprotein ApbE